MALCPLDVLMHGQALSQQMHRLKKRTCLGNAQSLVPALVDELQRLQEEMGLRTQYNGHAWDVH